MREMGLSFPKALRFVVKEIGYEEKAEDRKTVRLPFGGFYKKITRQIEEPESNIETYSENLLQEYLTGYSLKFFQDGIDFQTQQKFKIGFDLETLRTTIPEYTLNGQLCGIMGRSIDSQCPKEERWLPIIPCSRSLTLYGYHRNYRHIQEKQMVLIAESEKAVCQLHSMGSFNSLSTCGCRISSTQARYIKGLMLPKIIVAYDEGLEEDFLREETQKLVVDNEIYRNKVGYIYDKDNQFMEKGSKCSPTDLGKEKLLQIIKNCTVWL
jgi:DNA primase